MDWMPMLLAALGGLCAGFMNAVAGGGTLVSFPMLVAGGLSPYVANMTSTVALCPGYIGGIRGQWKDVRTLGTTVWISVAAAAAGAVLGGLLLVQGGADAFRRLVPWLLFGASALLAGSDLIRTRILARTGTPHPYWLAVPVGAAAVYGGYFGAGMSVMVLAVLGLWSGDPMNRLNAHKQVIGLAVNGAAAVYFLFGAPINWPAAAAMSAGALLGGWLGGRMASGLRPELIRWTAVTVGLVSGILYW